MITYLGPIVGPICGGYLTQYVNWRWTFWLTVIMAGLLSIWVALVPETHAPTILKRRAKRIAKETGNANLKTYYEVEGGHMSAKNILGAALRRPFELLFGELIVTLVAIYVSLMSGILYLFFGVS